MMKVYVLAGLCSLIYINGICQTLPADLPPPARIYTLVCGECANEEEADLCQSRVATLGFGPIQRVVNQEKKILVCLGRFETNSEAWAARKDMGKSGLLNLKILAQDNTAKEEFSTDIRASIEPLIAPKQSKFSAVEGKGARTDAVTKPFMDSLALQDRDLIAKAGVDLIDQLPDEDPMKARASIEAGRAIIQQSKESAGALPYLLRVAKGEVAASRDDLLEARIMVADSWHYYWFAPLKAYRAYKEIVEAHGTDPGIKARCMVEMAACLLELAQMPDREYGCSFDDARRACLKVLKEVPVQYKRARAVADLMYCESFTLESWPLLYKGAETKAKCDELNHRCFDLFIGFEQRHPGRIREISMALDMQANCAYVYGDWATSKAIFEKILAMNLSDPNECFYWKGERWNMKDRASSRLVLYAECLHDEATLAKYRDYRSAEQYKQGAPPEDSMYDKAFPHRFYTERKEIGQ